MTILMYAIFHSLMPAYVVYGYDTIYRLDELDLFD